MEKNQFTESFLPFLKVGIERTTEYAKEFLEKKTRFSIIGLKDQLILKFLTKIIGNAESSLGSVFSIIDAEKNNPVPLPWSNTIQRLVKEKIITEIKFEEFFCDEPKFFEAVAVENKKLTEPGFTDGNLLHGGLVAHGDSLSHEEAITKVVGEILERYTLAVYWEKNLKKASISDLNRKKIKFLDVRKYQNFSEEQKENEPDLRYNDQTKFAWVEAESILNKGEKVLIPAQFIFWNYKFKRESWKEPILRDPNSNGSAGHFNLKRAILSGVYEIIERDGFLIYWLNSIPPVQIDSKSFTYKPFKELIEETERLKLKAYFLSTTTDIGIPSCACAIVDDSGTGPKVVFGGGCQPDIERAFYKALIEALAIYHWRRKAKIVNKKEFPFLEKIEKPFCDKKMGHFDRINLWANEKMFEKIRFFLSGKKVSIGEMNELPVFKNTNEEFEYVRKIFKRLGKGYEIYFYESKHKLLDDFGYRVVKVIIPEMVNLYLRELLAPIKSERLSKVPEMLGYRKRDNLNFWPHPFP